MGRELLVVDDKHRMMAVLIGIVIVLLVLLAIYITKKLQRLQLRRSVPTGKKRKAEDTERTMKPQQRENIEQYTLKTAAASTLRIGKIHAIGKRKNQQDTFAYSELEAEDIVKEKGILLIVADGMGGLSNGADVSALVAVSMLQYFDSRATMEDPAQELYQMVQLANDEVNRFLGEEGIGQSGSTVVAVLIREHQVYWISVGDSSIFLFHDNKMERLNALHNYGEELKEMVARGEMTEEEAKAQPQKSALTSYIGAGDLKYISQNSEPLLLASGDRLMLASDGIYGTASEQELEDMMSYDVEEAALKLRYLIESKNKRHQDNFTAIIVEDNY